MTLSNPEAFFSSPTPTASRAREPQIKIPQEKQPYYIKTGRGIFIIVCMAIVTAGMLLYGMFFDQKVQGEVLNIDIFHQEQPTIEPPQEKKTIQQSQWASETSKNNFTFQYPRKEIQTTKSSFPQALENFAYEFNEQSNIIIDISVFENPTNLDLKTWYKTNKSIDLVSPRESQIQVAKQLALKLTPNTTSSDNAETKQETIQEYREFILVPFEDIVIQCSFLANMPENTSKELSYNYEKEVFEAVVESLTLNATDETDKNDSKDKDLKTDPDENTTPRTGDVDTSKWKTYANTANGLSMKLPSDAIFNSQETDKSIDSSIDGGDLDTYVKVYNIKDNSWLGIDEDDWSEAVSSASQARAGMSCPENVKTSIPIYADLAKLVSPCTIIKTENGVLATESFYDEKQGGTLAHVITFFVNPNFSYQFIDFYYPEGSESKEDIYQGLIKREADAQRLHEYDVFKTMIGSISIK